MFDEDHGHGVFVASLIKRLAPEADVTLFGVNGGPVPSSGRWSPMLFSDADLIASTGAAFGLSPTGLATRSTFDVVNLSLGGAGCAGVADRLALGRFLRDLVTWVSFAAVDGQLTAVRVAAGEPQLVPLGPADRLVDEAAITRDPTVVFAAAEEVDGAPCSARSRSVPARWRSARSVASTTCRGGSCRRCASDRSCWRHRCGCSDAARRPRSACPGRSSPWPGRACPSPTWRHSGSSTAISRVLLLTDTDATVAAVGDAMRSADVAHLVCHGRFSADNPMFSSLLMADGPMFVYDLERITPPPKVIVLSACHAGAHAVPAGREILGLTASLLARGPRAVVAATVPVPDTVSTIELMTALHRLPRHRCRCRRRAR